MYAADNVVASGSLVSARSSMSDIIFIFAACILEKRIQFQNGRKRSPALLTLAGVVMRSEARAHERNDGETVSADGMTAVGENSQQQPCQFCEALLVNVRRRVICYVSSQFHRILCLTSKLFHSQLALALNLCMCKPNKRSTTTFILRVWAVIAPLYRYELSACCNSSLDNPYLLILRLHHRQHHGQHKTQAERRYATRA